MFFDTHCHLNFASFDGRVEEVILKAKSVGVNQIVIPGTDVPTSKKAIAIAEKYEGTYSAVGIHPHHVFEIWKKIKPTIDDGKLKIGLENRKSKIEKNQPSIIDPQLLSSILNPLSSLLVHPKVVAVGEVGIDRHMYQKTKHKDYKIDEEFVELQKIFFLEQIKLAAKYKKAVIIHNREAKKDVLQILKRVGIKPTPTRIADYHSVFHCCEPDLELLEFAKAHKMFIGVDGDVTYHKEKQEWIKAVPLEMLVLETDSPFLNPRLHQGSDGQAEPMGNVPANIPLIAEFIANLKGVSVEQVEKQTTENARILFNIK